MNRATAYKRVHSLPKAFKDPGLKAGEKVSVRWEKSGSKKLADEVTIAK